MNCLSIHFLKTTYLFVVIHCSLHLLTFIKPTFIHLLMSQNQTALNHSAIVHFYHHMFSHLFHQDPRPKGRARGFEFSKKERTKERKKKEKRKKKERKKERKKKRNQTSRFSSHVLWHAIWEIVNLEKKTSVVQSVGLLVRRRSGRG